jgi:hypothetical protein
VVAEQIDVGVVGSGDPLALRQSRGQPVLGYRLEEPRQPGVVVEVRVEQHPGDLGQQEHLVVGRPGDRGLVLGQAPPGLGVGVRQQLVEQVHEPVGDADEALGGKCQQGRIAALGARLQQRLVRRRLDPASEGPAAAGRQHAEIPIAGTQLLQEQQLVHFVVHHRRRRRHWEVAQPRRPGGANLGVHCQETVEQRAAPVG